MENDGFLDYIRRLLLRGTANPVSAVGTLLALSATILFAIFILVYLVSAKFINPYYGALVFLGFPGVIIASGFLIVIGKLFFKDKPHKRIFWVKSLNIKDERRAFAIFGGFILFLVVALGISHMQVGDFMNSTRFCGETCHAVMEPEAVAHANSPHSKVACIECHIGEGVESMLVSKWRGAWQVASVTLDLYEKPIPTPVTTLPSSEDTCQTCHDTTKEPREKISVYKTFKDDEKSSGLVTAHLMKIGTSKTGEAHGVHAHASQDLQVRYYSKDRKLKNIIWVEATTPEGTRSWSFEGENAPEIVNVSETKKGRPIYEIKGEGVMREMDCTDCHNRVGHNFAKPKQLVNQFIADGKINRALPYAEKFSMKALKLAEEAPKNEIQSRIEKELSAVWKLEDGVEEVTQLLTKTSQKYLYPRMNIKWNSYPNNLGHSGRNEGCFRCHNQRMKNEAGKNITQDCDSCHFMVADDTPEDKWNEIYLNE